MQSACAHNTRPFSLTTTRPPTWQPQHCNRNDLRSLDAQGIAIPSALKPPVTVTLPLASAKLSSLASAKLYALGSQALLPYNTKPASLGAMKLPNGEGPHGN